MTRTEILDGYLVTNRLVTNDKKHVLPKNSRDVLRSGIVQRSGRSIRDRRQSTKGLFAILPKGKRGRFELILAGQEDLLAAEMRTGAFSIGESRRGHFTGHGSWVGCQLVGLQRRSSP